MFATLANFLTLKLQKMKYYCNVFLNCEVYLHSEVDALLIKKIPFRVERKGKIDYWRMKFKNKDFTIVSNNC